MSCYPSAPMVRQILQCALAAPHKLPRTIPPPIGSPVSPRSRPASVAIILRASPYNTTSQPAPCNGCHCGTGSAGLPPGFMDTELLFIRRATNPKDPWSGNV
eukprot:RCo023410